MYETFIEKRFHPATQNIINKANIIIDDYQQQGYTLTLRQLYYQFVARDYLPNTQASYAKLSKIISDARLTGWIDWTAIEDRTRNVRSLPTWSSPREILDSAIYSYRTNKWGNQPYIIEVWIEKEALIGVIARICNEYEVSYFACRGYTSQSEQWRAAKRFENYIKNGQIPIVLHLGDHDPSGIDMTRDNKERLELLSRYEVEVKRLALNYDQVETYNPPPNPAKLTDTRADSYISKFGNYSWELDALEPSIINDLIKKEIELYRDEILWQKALEKQERQREEMTGAIKDLR